MRIDAAAWDDSIGALLALAVEDVADIRAQVEAGAGKLFRLTRDGEMVAAFVLRIDRLHGGDDGVIVAAGPAGAGGDVNLTASVLPAIERMFSGCRRVRIHTARPGLGKILGARHGYALQELVLAKVIA